MAIMESSGIWVLAEQTDGRVQRISHELLARGRELADKRHSELTAVVLGQAIHDNDLRELIERGADSVLAMEAPELAHFLVEPYAACLQHLIDRLHPEVFIAGATSTGRTLMPYVAVKVHAGLTADCTELEIEAETGNLLKTRPAIGGNILATIKTPDCRPQMATVRPHATRPLPRQAGRRGRIERVRAPPQLLVSRIRRMGFVKSPDERGLAEADTLVVVGRGIRKGENIKALQPLLDALACGLGGSREVVDRGWLGYPRQIGLSGKTVSPRLYIAVGISGAIQHLAGMQTSEQIIAINNDPDAQIFRVADMGIVGNLFDIVPVLAEKIRRARSGAQA
jgi:electron transfer flavoprotein alpha subunit